jgi:hypothetical protein
MKKAQSAVEYLYTYGWALLIISITLGIIIKFNIFNICTTTTSGFMGQAIDVRDWKIDNSGELTIVLQNNAGKKITINSINGDISASGDIEVGDYSTFTTSTGISSGNEGSCYSEDISITFTANRAHTVVGSLKGKFT